MAIHQEVTIKASARAIYSALITSAEFSQVTGAPADIVPDAGGAFSIFGGQITGCNIELISNKMIVQAWRAGSWPESVHSVVRFTLDQAGEETKVTLDHSGFPEGTEQHLESGWHRMYWEPLKSYCES